MPPGRLSESDIDDTNVSAASGAAGAPPLADGECQVWWARPQDAGPWLSTLFDPVERGRMAALRQPADRDRFAVGCALVRIVAGRVTGTPPRLVAIDRTCPTCGRPHGRPRLVGSDAGLELSVSHSGGRVAVAAARRTPIGVDVEQITATVDAQGLAPHVLTAGEQERLRRLPEPDRDAGFLAYWTRKESLLKATGHGLSIPPASFAVSAPDEEPRLLCWPAEPPLLERVAMHTLHAGAGHVASLSVLGGAAGRVAELDGSALLAAAAADWS
jgi:4'-phosphopantetheinyl transferase